MNENKVVRGLPRTTLFRVRGALVLGVLGVLAGGGVVVAALLGTKAEAGPPARAGDEVPVTAMHQGFGVANNSPLLVADPTEDRFMVMANRLDGPDFSCALQVSGDGGQGWTTAQPVPSLPAGAEKCYAPEAAFSGDGTLYYLFVGLAGAGNEPVGVYLTTSTDRARTFAPPRQILGPRNFGVRMAIDPAIGRDGRMHLVWLQATSDPPLGGFGPPPNPIMASFSDDGGQTFSEPVQVSDPDRQRVVAPALALGPDSAVHIAYYDLGADAIDYQGLEGPTWEGRWSLVLASSFDRGRRFERGVVVDDAIAPPERVMLIFTMPPAALAVDEWGVCSSWTDARHGDPDVLLRCSPDQGRTWRSAQRLNDDPIGNGRTQYLPRLSVAPDGRLDAVFYDRRDDPKNVLNDVRFTYSTDQAATFAPNLRLNAESFESRIGQRYLNVSAQGQVEFGARLGLLSRSSGALAAWTDTRNSTRLAGATGQDIFVDQVHLAEGRQMTGPVVLGSALALAGLLGISIGLKRRPGHLQPERVGDP